MQYVKDLPIKFKFIAPELTAWHSYITDEHHARATNLSLSPT